MNRRSAPDTGLLIIIVWAAARLLGHAMHWSDPVLLGKFLLLDVWASLWHGSWALLLLGVMLGLWNPKPFNYRLLLSWQALSVSLAVYQFAGFLFGREQALLNHEIVFGQPADLGTLAGDYMVKASLAFLIAAIIVIYAWRKRPIFFGPAD